MARRWHEPRTGSERRRRRLALAAPVAFALAGIAVTADRVFPSDTGSAVLLAGIFALGPAGAWLIHRAAPPVIVASVSDPATRVLDVETGLGNRLALISTLQVEMARAMRYHHRTAIAVVEVGALGFSPSAEGDQPPSPARFVADALRAETRGGDIIFRLSLDRFAIVLAECDQSGAKAITARLVERLSGRPFSRNDDGTAIFLRAHASGATYHSGTLTPEDYLEAAADGLSEPAAFEPLASQSRAAS